ncbi:MAG: TolC family outer membrane protein [Alphaproteobacteria bacterium]|nr:TolC family outer membrane protein [Alphaproteobacteria bacterium]MCZ6589039.1 TolC family outer membrane protein [Alphaproteobacteria bacterium]MCZ6847018.1 TolC family outer membrane protein [Alphaproteobacteria bacterium]
MIARNSIAVIGVTVLASFVGFSSSSVHAETLAEALTEAYGTNPDLVAERARVRAVDEQVPQALSNWRPQLFLSGRYGVRRIDRESGAGVDTERTDVPRSIGLAITQNLFRGFRTQAETERAQNRVAAARSNLIGTEQNVLLEGVVGYVTVLRDTAVLELRTNNVGVIEQQLQATRDRFEVGELTRTDVAQAESRLARAVADRTTAEANLETARAAYRKAIGRDPQQLQIPDLPPNLPSSEADALAAAANNNPNVVFADFNERAARADIELRKGELLPTLTLDATIDREKDVVGSDVKDTESAITARLSVPLYQSGAVYSRIREAKQTASQRLSELALSKREAEQDASDAWENFRASQARITSFESEVRAQEVAFEGVQQEAQVGSRTVLDVLDAEQELLDARVNLVSARRDLIVSGYGLLAAIGKLTAQDLDLAVDLYDPTRNFGTVRDKFFGSDIEDE